MPLHLEEFQRDQFQGYVESVEPRKEYKLARFMPNDETYDSEFSYNIISGGYGQMASITAWDSGAPLRDKDVLSRMTAELGKVQHGYRLTEKELLMFNRPRTDAEKGKVVKGLYDQTDKLVFGVHDREEWFRARAIYHGNLTYTEDGVDLNVDFQIPAENKPDADVLDVDGSLLAGADIIGAIQGAITVFEDANNGDSPEIMHLSPATEQKLLTSDQIKAHIYGSPTDTRILTVDNLKAFFTSMNFPAYEIVKDRVKGESGMETLLPDNRIVFIGDDLGNLMYGPTVENEYDPGIYVVPFIQKTNPPKEEVYVGASMFPALKRPSAVVHLNLI